LICKSGRLLRPQWYGKCLRKIFPFASHDGIGLMKVECELAIWILMLPYKTDSIRLQSDLTASQVLFGTVLNRRSFEKTLVRRYIA